MCSCWIAPTKRKNGPKLKCYRQKHVIRAVTGNWLHELLSFIWWEKERSFIHELSKYFPAPADSSSERVRCVVCVCVEFKAVSRNDSVVTPNIECLLQVLPVTV